MNSAVKYPDSGRLLDFRLSNGILICDSQLSQRTVLNVYLFIN